jgi:hypothetical protein
MGLNWAQWVLIGLMAVGSLVAIATIGQKREPRTPAEACIAVVLNVVCIWLVIEAGS